MVESHLNELQQDRLSQSRFTENAPSSSRSSSEWVLVIGRHRVNYEAIIYYLLGHNGSKPGRVGMEAAPKTT